MNRTFLRMVLLLAVAGAGLSAGGCGSGEYRQRVQQGQSNMTRQAKFIGLSDATKLGDTNVNVCIPGVFQASFKADSADNTGQPVNPQRLGNRIDPATVITYEAMTKANNVETAYILAFGVHDGQSLGGDPARALHDRVAALPKASAGEWQDKSFDTPDGGSIQWKQLQATANLGFFTKDSANPIKPMDGVIEIYLHKFGANTVSVIFVVPQDAMSTIDLSHLAEQVCGAVTAADAAPADAAK